MGSRGRPLFDLNQLPSEDNAETDGVLRFQPQKALPSTSSQTVEGLAVPDAPPGMLNNNAFQHAPSGSGFQPFVRPRSAHGPERGDEKKVTTDQSSQNLSFSKSNREDAKTVPLLIPGRSDVPSTEREEGEWSDAEGSGDVPESSSLGKEGKVSQEQGTSGAMDHVTSGFSADDNFLGVDLGPNDQSVKSCRTVEGNGKGDASMDGQEEPGCVSKQRDVKGIEASHAVKCANNPAKRKIDQQNEAKLGKKRNRQTMFLNLEDVKQAGPIKTSTPRRQSFSSTITTRTVKEPRTILPPAERYGEKQNQTIFKDQRQVDASSGEGGTPSELSDSKCESNGDMNYGLLARPRKLNGDSDVAGEALPPIPRQSSWKQPTDTRQLKNSQGPNRKPALIGQNSMDLKMGNKKLPPAKKQTTMSNSYQDTSVERLIREVTNEKFWHHPGMLFSYVWLSNIILGKVEPSVLTLSLFFYASAPCPLNCYTMRLITQLAKVMAIIV